MIVPVILAGGSGTRLWPLSRELYPKQFLPLVDRYSLLQNTVLRLRGAGGISPPIVICNENHRFLVAEQLRAVGIKPSSIILEPVGRNTAPAIAAAAISALRPDEDNILLVLPSDHHMDHSDSFSAAVSAGSELAEHDYLVTFGIVPAYPETGYGYIEKGEPVAMAGQGELNQVLRIRRFVEKPPASLAREYFDSGDYLWNSGMFMFRASRILEELRSFVPEVVAACERAYHNGSGDMDFYRLEAGAFGESPGISIDYAAMEKTERGVVIPLSTHWNDLGSWAALWEVQEKDAKGNVNMGDVMLHDVTNSYIHGSSRLVAAIGLDNLVVVETSDAVLIADWNRVQDVKVLVEQLKERGREEAVSHQKVYRPWGSYEVISMGNRFQVKRITIKPGTKLSLQRHHHRAEHWVVVRGTALVTEGDKEYILKEDESTYIPLGVTHRLENPGKIPLEIIEVQTGSYLGEDDILRFDDVFGRHEQRG